MSIVGQLRVYIQYAEPYNSKVVCTTINMVQTEYYINPFWKVILNKTPQNYQKNQTWHGRKRLDDKTKRRSRSVWLLFERTIPLSNRQASIRRDNTTIVKEIHLLYIGGTRVNGIVTHLTSCRVKIKVTHELQRRVLHSYQPQLHRLI